MNDFTATKFGYRDLSGAVANLADGIASTMWAFDNPSGLTNNSWVQIDFGRPVILKSFRFVKQQFSIGDFKVISSNTAATNGSDAIGADDSQSNVFRDLDTGTAPLPNYTGTTGPGPVASGQPNASYFQMPGSTTPCRYYRFMSAGSVPINASVLWSDIQVDYANDITQLGFTSSDLPWKMADGDFTTYWEPLADTFASYPALPPTKLTANVGALPFIQIDLGAPVSLAGMQVAITRNLEPAALAWDPSNKDAGITLSNSNLTATETTGHDSNVYGTIGHTTGKWYLEFPNVDLDDLRGNLGLANIGTATAIGINLNGNLSGTGVTAGNQGLGNPNTHNAQFAIDLDAKLYWVRYDGGTWAGDGGGADPATGVNGAVFTATGELFPWAQMLHWDNDAHCDIMDGTTLANTAPAGFDNWASVQSAGNALGDFHLIGSNWNAQDTAHAFMGAGATDVDLGFVNGTTFSGGTLFITGLDPATSYRYYRLVFGNGQGPNGDKIVEFTLTVSQILQYIESDFHSIWSIGDRVANGLMVVGETYTPNNILFGEIDATFNNLYSLAGLNFDPSIDSRNPIAAGTMFWWSTGHWGLILTGANFANSAAATETKFPMQIIGGLLPDAMWPASYSRNFDAYQYASASPQPVVPQAGATASGQMDWTPTVPIPWPVYGWAAFQDQPADPGGDQVWLGSELWLKVNHSNLDGGDRRNLGGTRPDKHVIMTASTGVNPDTDFSNLFDGIYEYGNSNAPGGAGTGLKTDQGASYCEIGTDAIHTTQTTPITVAGSWLKFQFPRNVTPNHLSFVTSNGFQESYTGSAPNNFGVWHWEYSDDNAHWTAIGDPWSFTEACNFMIAPRQTTGWDPKSPPASNLGFQLPDVVGHQLWRMVLDSGSAFGGSHGMTQVMFNLTDRGNQGIGFACNMSDGDDDGLNVPTNFIGIPGNPFVVKLSDGIEDGLTATITIIKAHQLTFVIDDGGDIEFVSRDLMPSQVVQTVTVITGT